MRYECQSLYLLKYQWEVEIYYAVTCYYTEEILKKLEEYNPTYEEKDKLENFIKRCKYNEGFIFTNFEKKKSLIIKDCLLKTLFTIWLFLFQDYGKYTHLAKETPEQPPYFSLNT